MGTTQNLDRNDQFYKECICGLQGLADFLGVCKKTAWTITKQNRIPYYRVNAKYFYRIPEILEAMSSKNTKV